MRKVLIGSIVALVLAVAGLIFFAPGHDDAPRRKVTAEVINKATTQTQQGTPRRASK